MPKQVANAVEVTCAQCGKRKKVAPLRAQNYICCSADCHAAYNAAKGLKEDEFTCQGCGGVFTRRENLLKAKYCSRKCLGEHKKRQRVQIVCRNCGRTFARPKSHARTETKYCSKACWMEATKRDVLEKNKFNCQNCGKETTFRPPFSLKTKYCSQECAAEAKKTGVQKICEICGKEFYSTIGRKRFCSNACRYAHAKKSNLPTVAVNCEQCGRLIYKLPDEIKRTENSFCDLSCRARFYHSGEKNNHWKGGITSIRKRIRELAECKAWQLEVFQRDQFRCKLCGRPGGVLNAHHAVPFSVLLTALLTLHGFSIEDKSQADQIIAAARVFRPLWDTVNGITLCEGCHDMVHGTTRRKRDGE